MATNDQEQQLAAIFTHHLQALIGQIVNTKVSELIVSGDLGCSHCSNNSQLPWSPVDSKVLVPTSPLQGFDKQLTMLERQLSEQATKLQQVMENHSYIEVNNTPKPSANSIATNPSTSANLIDKLANFEQRLTDL